ncbi:MAG: UDP-glucose/GDP-mannose dehydrogenase family protein [Thermoplasmata archaeon]|nr:UDP-glucose/GDP-mannose dehydrogenase family protein [Thermoplasmata archaeon]
MASISIIGSGFVGQTQGKYLEGLGHDVSYYDISETALKRFSKSKRKETVLHAVTSTEASFICVPTPFNNGFDASIIKSIFSDIAKAIPLKQSQHLIVVKSTVLPGTTEKLLLPLLLKNVPSDEARICVNPEFVTEISSTWTDDEDFLIDKGNEGRIVIGALNKESGEWLKQIYSKDMAEVFLTDLKTAEMTKYAANCMLAVKISYWNEIFLICEELSIDSNEVARLTTLDSRIGEYGSIHGKAFGGKCLPKDLKSLMSLTGNIDGVGILKAANRVNDWMAEHYGVRE